MTQSLPIGKTPLITRYRVIVSVLLALAAAIFYVGVTRSVDPPEESVGLNRFVTSVEPEPNALALRQAHIVARLASGYTGVLLIDGVEIPEDQLDRLEGINTVGFTPGKGTETGALKPGRRCATVVYWPIESTRARASGSHGWCWSVH